MQRTDLLAALVFGVLASSGGLARGQCPPPPETAEAVAVEQDGTIRLADGREIVFAGIELSAEGRAALPAFVRERPLTIRPLGRADRWGRQPAHVDEVEEVLAAQGLAHAAAQARDACLAPILAAEAQASAHRRGIWRQPALSATDGEALTARLGRHIVAEGRVASARLHRGRIYLNFARYWKSGLSLIIAEKDWPLFAGGAPVDSLTGKRLRARGHLEWRGGPAILAGAGDRIEILP